MNQHTSANSGHGRAVSSKSAARGRSRSWRVAAAAALCGSLMGTTCQTRLRDSVIDGTRLLVSQILDPSNLIIAPDDEEN